MTKKERNKLYVARCLLDGKMIISEGAELLCLSERQVQRLKKGVDAEGEVFVIHKNRGRKPRHALSALVKERVVTLKKKEVYISANFSHFQELLDEHESLSLSRSSVYRVLVAKGLQSPRKHSKKKSHTRRKRKPRRGMLVVMDASPFSWFVDGKAYSLHGAIDDATGAILALFLMPQECLEGYFTLMRTILSRYGIPLAVYVDRHTIFRSPKEGKLSLEEELSGKRVKETQFGRAMGELGITLIWAKSPQAKGNIEKLWDTLQSRLPVELKISGITTPEEANAFLATFIEKYNHRFAREPRDGESAFRPLEEGVELDCILCRQDTRKVDNASTFSFGGSSYRITQERKTLSLPSRSVVTVCTSPRFGVKVLYQGSLYEVEVLEEVPKKPMVPQPVKKARKPVIPKKGHPWKNPSPSLPLSSLESDREILEALYNSTLAWR